MSRRVRMVRNIAIVLAALVATLVVVALLVVRTDWFRGYVRRTIISGVEESTGGRVEVGSFEFDEGRLRAIVRNFVVHGNEAPTARPFVAVQLIEMDLRLFTSLSRLYDISFLGIDKPEVNVTLLANGQTNIPTPRQKSASSKSPLETVVDLAVGRFALNDGSLTLFSVKQPLTVQGRNLRARLEYSLPRQAYDGRLTMEPLYVLDGRSTPVNFRVALPVTLTKDRIDLHHATLTTPLSEISADGSIENMKSPKFSAHVQGRIAGADLANAGDIALSARARQSLPELDLDANATADADTVKVSALHVGFGASSIEGSGTLKGPHSNGALEVRAELALAELARIVPISSRPAGTLSLNADVKLDANDRYDAGGNIEARNLSLTMGRERIANISFASAFHADPQALNLNGLRLNAFGGEFEGNASLEDFERYKLDGRLRGLDIQAALQALGQRIPYDGSISGPVEAQGDTKAAGTKGIAANAHLVISPGRRGIPVSGRLNAAWNGNSDDVVVENSYIALPHSRLNLSGSLNRRLNVAVTSKDLRDLPAAVPVALARNGEADFNGAVTGGLTSPHITGHLAVNRFAIQGRQFNSLAADVSASPSLAAVSNAVLVRNTMQARANASLALRNWSPTPRSPLAVNAVIDQGDLADLMVLAGQPADGYAGALSASARITGTYGNPYGAASLQAVNGTIAGEPFDHLQVQANMSDQLVTVPVAYIDSPAGRVDLKAELHHPRDSFSTGQVHAHVESTPLDLARLPAIEKAEGPSSGTLAMNVDIGGDLRPGQPAFLPTAVNGDISARGLKARGVSYGDLTATARTSGRTVAYNLTSDFAGSKIHVAGDTELTKDYPTRADLDISGLPIERALAVAGQAAIAARGVLTASAHVSGTITDPRGDAQLDLAKAQLYDEKIDDAKVRVSYLPQSIDVAQFEVVEGPSRLNGTAHYDHPAGDFKSGQARFTVAGNRLDLARSGTIQGYRPGLGGILNINGSGAANIRPASPEILLTALNADISASGITAQGKQYGDLKLTATTQAGPRVAFALDSDLAGATIHGSGNAELEPQYPVDARLSFRNITWNRLAPLIGQTTAGPPLFDAATDGDVMVRGPLLDAKRLNGALNVTKLEFTTIPRGKVEKPVTIANRGPVQVALDQGRIRIQNAHLTGPETDIQASGSAAITGEDLNLDLRANADVGLAQKFDRDIYSSGAVALSATVRGGLPRPLVNGQLTLKNVAFSALSVPIGVANANGTVVFNGDSARIGTLTAESGGGRLSLSGSASFSDAPRFALRADASNVRVRVQQGVTITADAGIVFSGTPAASRITGTATVNRVSYASQTDVGSILTRSAPPVQAPAAPSPLLSNMKLDVRVRSSPGLTIESTLAEDVQADVDLRVRGSVDEPGVLGRITVSEGKLLFFGSTYTVDSGTIGFYDPLRIEPVLDVSLEAQAQGVNVTLRVTGPIDDMKLSYTSDPPLQFQEIVALLAAGKTPTSDPTLLANQPSAPQQGYQQMGESAILGQAVANPVSSQLQRVFGVTQLKIDPSFTTGSNVPTAQLALQQRITNNVTFTYISAIDNPNSSVIRVEWAFDPRWEAVATRDQFGIFSINFFYKRGIR